MMVVYVSVFDKRKVVFAMKNNKKLIAIIGICVVLVAAIVSIIVINSDKGTAEALVTEAENQVITETENESVAPVTASQEQLDKVVYSAQVGDVNGTTYSVINVGTVLDDNGNYMKPSETPVIPRLPVMVEGYITSFAQYGDYVYYVLTEDDKWGESNTLYRCKVDFTENELLFKDDHSGKVDFVIYDYFAIDDGKLYIPNIEDETQKNQCIDLATNQVAEFEPVDYRAMFVELESEREEIYNGNVFVGNLNLSEGKNAFAYHVVDGERIALVDETESAKILENYVCGYADGGIYFSQAIDSSDTSYNSVLKRYDISTKKVTVVDKRALGGNGNFFKMY